MERTWIGFLVSMILAIEFGELVYGMEGGKGIKGGEKSVVVGMKKTGEAGKLKEMELFRKYVGRWWVEGEYIATDGKRRKVRGREKRMRYVFGGRYFEIESKGIDRHWRIFDRMLMTFNRKAKRYECWVMQGGFGFFAKGFAAIPKKDQVLVWHLDDGDGVKTVVKMNLIGPARCDMQTVHTDKGKEDGRSELVAKRMVPKEQKEISNELLVFKEFVGTWRVTGEMRDKNRKVVGRYRGEKKMRYVSSKDGFEIVAKNIKGKKQEIIRWLIRYNHNYGGYCAFVCHEDGSVYVASVKAIIPHPEVGIGWAIQLGADPDDVILEEVGKVKNGVFMTIIRKRVGKEEAWSWVVERARLLLDKNFES